MSTKNMANGILALFFFLFILVNVIKHFYQDVLAVTIMNAVVSGAMIGGIADWFAVTALFRKPLGIPWHTAVISRQREKVIIQVSDMIEFELLSANSIKNRIDTICFTGILIQWLEARHGKEILKNAVSKYSKECVSDTTVGEFAGTLENLVRTKLAEIKLCPYITGFTQAVVRKKNFEKIMEYMVDECLYLLQEANGKEVIYYYLEEVSDRKTISLLEKAIFWLGKQTDSVNLAEASDALYTELVKILQEAKQADSELHQLLYTKTVEWVNTLETNTSWCEIIEEWQVSLLANNEMMTKISAFIKEVRENAMALNGSSLVSWLYEQMDSYWYRFVNDQQAQERAEARFKQITYQFIEQEHHMIGHIVRSVLYSYSNEDLNAFIEDKAGDDLQWIRINGCLVGGMVGLLLFMFIHFVYSPMIIPVIQYWFI